jgi:enoyl-CoA hydratase
MSEAHTVEGLQLERVGAAAVATIARPSRRNALDHAMQMRFAAWYPGLARDPMVYCAVLRSSVPGVFSVGGDVRELIGLATGDLAAARAAMADEIRLFWLQECFSKPTVSLIDGTVMGSGVGITLYGTHRVAGDRYAFSMPETAIGFFPDAGMSHAFARMPGSIGVYLGLTGATVTAGDALALGLVTHVVPVAAFDGIVRSLADADPVDPLLDGLQIEPSATPLLSDAGRIARYFDAPSVAAIAARLEAASHADREWATSVLDALRRRSPLALCLTHRAIREAASLDIRATLAQDYRIGARLVASDDFREGVAAFFASLAEGELDLPDRTAMQSARG